MGTMQQIYGNPVLPDRFTIALNHQHTNVHMVYKLHYNIHSTYSKYSKYNQHSNSSRGTARHVNFRDLITRSSLMKTPLPVHGSLLLLSLSSLMAEHDKSSPPVPAPRCRRDRSFNLVLQPRGYHVWANTSLTSCFIYELIWPDLWWLLYKSRMVTNSV